MIIIANFKLLKWSIIAEKEEWTLFHIYSGLGWKKKFHCGKELQNEKTFENFDFSKTCKVKNLNQATKILLRIGLFENYVMDWTLN